MAMASTQSSAKATSKQINIYIRRHPFVLSSTESFTTSQRRAFLRDVYDYARSLGLDKKGSKQQIVRAREMCGEDEYDTDVSALENEIDDSEMILSKLQNPGRATNGTIRNEDSKDSQESRHDPDFSISKGTTNQYQKRRKVDTTADERSGTTTQAMVNTSRRTVSTNRVIPVKQRKGYHVLKRGDNQNKSYPQNGLSSNLSRERSSTERELIITSKPVTSYDPADLEYGSSSPEVMASKKQIASHLNTASVASVSDPPTTSSDAKNAKTNAKNFVPPEVAMFSDDENDTAVI